MKHGTPSFCFSPPNTHTKTLIMGAIYSSVTSCIIYRWIILPRKERRRKQRENNNVNAPSAYLVGFGIVMPFCAISPYYYLRCFGIKNKILKFLAGVAQLTSFFRCSEGKRVVCVWKGCIDCTYVCLANVHI